jgi:hypothetical protein
LTAVADALDGVGDAHGRGDEAEVAGHGLVEGEEVDARLVELELHGVHLLVALDDGAGSVHRPLVHGLEGGLQQVLGAARHGQQAGPDGGQVVAQVSRAGAGAHPNLPVM